MEKLCKHRRDATRNGKLRDPDVNKLLETTGAHQSGEVQRRICHQVGHHLGLSAVRHVHLGTDSRGVPAPPLHPCPPAHGELEKHFANVGDHKPGTDVFTWRRSQYFWKHKASIGFGNAVAVARRAHHGYRIHRSRIN